MVFYVPHFLYHQAIISIQFLCFLTLFYTEQVQILDNSVCQALYGIMTDNMMCTSGDNGRGTCYGDSGGPAVVKQPDGSYVQVREDVTVNN
jgi:hypothetical protein